MHIITFSNSWKSIQPSLFLSPALMSQVASSSFSGSPVIHWSRSSKYCALIGRDHRDTALRLVDFKVMLSTPALLCHKEPAQSRGISCLSLVLYHIRIGGFNAGKGFITGAGLSNVLIPPIIDSLCARPPFSVS